MVPLCLPGQRRSWQGRLASSLRAQLALETLETRSSPSMIGPMRMLVDIGPDKLQPMMELSSASAAVSAGDPNASESVRDALTAIDIGTLDHMTAVMQPLAVPTTTVLANSWPPNVLNSAGLETSVANRGPARLDDTNDPAPVITDFSGSEGTDRWWTFEGHVDALCPRGMIVQFGGLPTLQNQTATVDEYGNFSLTIQLANCEEGMATAQTTDWNGHLSNIAEDFVHQTGCIIGNTHPD